MSTSRSGRTMVRLIMGPEGHYNFSRHKARVEYNKIADDLGVMIPILLPPFKPEQFDAATNYWECGSRLFWEIDPDFVADRGVFGRRFVCEHMIELD